jgi:diguanylate cyclase (GGDEF)-like protein/PAS domain S-box-containing protein
MLSLLSKRISIKGKGFLNALERLVGISETGNLNIEIDTKDIDGTDTEAVRLLNEVFNNYRSAMEHELIKYRLTGEAFDIALWDMDVVDSDPINPKNTFTWSHEFRVMLGFKSEYDFPNVLHSWSDRLHPDDKEKTLNAFYNHLTDPTGRTPYDIQYRLMLKNGDYRHFRALGATQRDGAGTPLRVAGAIKDITEIVQTQDALTLMEHEAEKKNEMNRVMFDAAPIALTIFDESLKIIDCNDAALEMYGITKDYYIASFASLSPDFQYDGSKSGDKLPDIMKRALQGEKIILEWVHCAPSGEHIPCETTLTRIKQGEVFIGLCYQYDMRHFIKMEKALSEVEELSREVMDASPISYILFDMEFNPIDCNDAALRTFECPNKQFFLDNYWKIFSPVRQPDGQYTIEKAVALREHVYSNGKAVSEWIYHTYTGEELPVEKTLTPLIHNGERLIISFEYDLRDKKKMENEIQYLEIEAEKIYTDPLTGIYNRRYLDKSVSILIETLSRSGSFLSLMMVDVDFFKKYNDTYGHSEGDNCLKIIANAILDSITRKDDIVARYGGEEFALVLPNTDENGARMIAEKIIENIRSCNIPHDGSDAADCVTVSIGVTTCKAEHKQNAEEYIKKADELLYQSKHDGRNRYTFAMLIE